MGQLFRVQDANLRGRVALQALERWPLSACLELLEFCLNDPNTENSLMTDLELKKKELDIYHWVSMKLGYLFLNYKETVFDVRQSCRLLKQRLDVLFAPVRTFSVYF